jgi:hypothetical protein
MSRQYQDLNYHYQASYPDPPQQPGQLIQPSPNTYNDRLGQQGILSPLLFFFLKS